MRVNKQNNKFFVYLSSDMVSGLRLKENDELEFLPFNGKSFLVAKKSDLAYLLTANIMPATVPEQQPKDTRTQAGKPDQKISFSEEEMFVLKKLDELRYNMRTVDTVNTTLDNKYKPVLQKLIKAKFVTIFKGKDGKEIYSISKYVYDNFLMRKRSQAISQTVGSMQTQKQSQQPRNINSQFFYRKQASPEVETAEIEELDKNGFIVLQTEAEAASISMHLEDSIKHGMVLGTRAFNKRFYIVTRAFFEKHSPGLIKLLRQSPSSAVSLAESEKIDEEAVRGIMYLLAEAGDVREQRKDIFALA